MAAAQGEIELSTDCNDVGDDIRLRADVKTGFEEFLHGCVTEGGSIINPYFDGPGIWEGDIVGVYNHS